MKKIYFLILISAAMFSQSLFSQTREIKNIIATADMEFKKKNYYGAGKLYEDALKLDKRMYNITWLAAESFRLDNDYINAAKHYRILADKVSNKYPEAVFYYALMLKANEEYIRAQYFFQKYIMANNHKDDIFMTRAKKEIFDCEFGWKMYNRPNGYNVIQVDTNINSVYSEYSAFMTKNNVILFSSIKPEKDSLKNFESKIFLSQLDNKSFKSKLFDPKINIPGHDISNPSMNLKGNKIYFTISDFFNEGNTYIYTSDYIEGEWTNPQKLPDKINIPGYNSTQPFLVERNNNNDILLWVSNRPESEGGYDIYHCEVLENNSYGLIKNLGRPILENNMFAKFHDTTSVINTPGNEITPYYNTKDSTLYFSSDWHQNMGGYDIFYVKGDFEKWGEIKNMGYPINSAQNDLYYKQFPDQHLAFLTSNRKSALSLNHQSCCNDIFYHEIEQIIDEETIEKQRIVIITSRTKLLVPITLYFHNDIPNPNSWDTITTLNYSDTYFNYLDMQENYRKSYSRGLSKKDRLTAIDSVDHFFSYYVQENFNKLLEFTNLTKELLQSGQKINITIKGYTSPLNTVEYNDNLAKRRISSLVNYFNEFDDGFFNRYIEDGLLTYEFVAFGKTLSNKNVSDDPNDPRNSIYSPAASRERRIEIIAISVEEFKQN